jgi:hypothetical protein
VTVTNTPVRLDTLAGLHQGQRLIIRNNNTTNSDGLILGGPGVTAANGFALAALSQIEIGREEIWGIRANATSIPTAVISLGAGQ